MKELAVTNSNIVHSFDREKLLSSFIDYSDISNASVRTYVKGIKQLFKFFAERRICTPTRDNIIDFKKHLVANRCSANTINLYIACVKKFFSWLEVEGLYSNITTGIKGVKVSRNFKKDALSAEQLKQVVNGIDTHTEKGLRDLAMTSLMAVCGLRSIEVVRANVGDIRNVNGQAVLGVVGKRHSEADDFVNIPAQVLRILQAYLNERGTVTAHEPLFTSTARRNKGQRLTTRTVSGVVKTALRNVGYNTPRITCHSLRHTAITLALMNGISLQEVQQFARHAQINTTLVYAHNIDKINSRCECAVANTIF